MLIPIGTSVQTVRRVPYLTFGLLFVNILLCVCTSWMSDPGTAKLSRVREQILELNAYYPDAHGSADAQEVIREARQKNPASFQALVQPDELMPHAVPPLIAQIRNGEFTADDAMLDLSNKLAKAEQQSFLWNFAFHSYRPTGISAVSSSFLHEGAMHLLGNMWFLYLTGAILEAAWGNAAFLVFYLLGGVAALGGQTIAHPDSMRLVVGASGAVAACMGAFLVRFPKVRVKFVWILYIWFRGGTYQFSIPAFYVLPLWVCLEVVYGAVGFDNIAHWAHVAGFVFGVACAFIISKTGLEDWVNREDDTQTWHPDGEILQAMSLMDQKQPDKAIAVLQQYVERKPDSLDGLETLLQVQQSVGDRAGECETLGALCRLALRSRKFEEAWKRYGEWKAAGGAQLAAGEWIELCRSLEREKLYDNALAECESLVKAYPNEPQGFEAMLIAARVSLNRLKRPEDAERWYLLARESSFARLEFEGAIQDGLKSCAKQAAAGQ